MGKRASAVVFSDDEHDKTNRKRINRGRMGFIVGVLGLQGFSSNIGNALAIFRSRFSSLTTPLMESD
jgi:hypothetical protein